jgi:AmmeMemoRadiSam system protein A
VSDGEIAEAERRRLFEVARAAIAARAAGRSAVPHQASGVLGEKHGAFVTLRRCDGELRGCVGYVEPLYPLIETVGRAAIAAAFEDGRFAPVTAEELPSLRVEISVLGPVRPIQAESVQPGVHGLIVRHAGRSGLLLPQVATEHGWDRQTFLEHTCRKAGLPSGAWRSPGAELLAFTATVIGEGEV